MDPIQVYSTALHCESTKSLPFYLCDNFPNSKPIQIIFGRITAVKIWNKLIHDNFDIYSLCVASLHRKMTPIFLSVPDIKILCHFSDSYCDDNTAIEIVVFSL